MPGARQAGSESTDNDTHDKLSRLDVHPTSAAVRAERAFARALGATCHSPVGALAEVARGEVRLRAQILSEDGRTEVTDEARFPIGDDRAASELAKGMLSRAPQQIRRLFAPE